MQDLEIINNSYLIIGAPKTNKSEVARLLAKKFNYKLINLDREKHNFFDDFTDYDFNIYQNLKDIKGDIKALTYIHKYEMKHLNYVLENIKDLVVLDFGNTYTLIDDKELLNKIKMFKNIVLLESNIEINNELESKLKNNKINKIISTININVNNKSIEDIVNEIVNYKEFKNIL